MGLIYVVEDDRDISEIESFALKNSGYDVASNERIASEVGFGNNPKYFEKVFKKYTGCTPKSYRKKNS